MYADFPDNIRKKIGNNLSLGVGEFMDICIDGKSFQVIHYVKVSYIRLSFSVYQIYYLLPILIYYGRIICNVCTLPLYAALTD
jgi:hypothetical protein